MPTALQVIAEPRFGTISGTTYSPGPDFWLAGADRIRFRNPSTGEVFTAVIRAAEMSAATITHEDFEESSIDQIELPWFHEGILDTAAFTSTALNGQWSLVVNLEESFSGAGSQGTSSGQGHLGVGVVINIEAPEDPLTETDFEAGLINIDDYAGVKLRRAGEVIEVNAWAGTRLGCTPLCETSWQALTAAETYHLTLSVGRQDLEDPTEEWGLTLAIQAANGSWNIADQMSGLSAPTGPLEFDGTGPSGLLSGNPSGSLIIDDVVTWASTLEALPGLRVEDFERSPENNWSTQGHLSVVDTGTEHGTSGAIHFRNPVAGSTTAWIDDGPIGSKKVTAHAQVDLSELTLPPGSAFQVFSGTNASGANVFFAVIKIQPDGSAKVQARLKRPTGEVVTSSWASLGEGTHDIEVAWSANEDGSATLRLWADEEYRELDVLGAGQGVTVEKMTIGAKFLVLGQPTDGGGSLLIDDVLLTY